MSDREIRDRLLAVCALLDARARAAARLAVVPTVLGVGVALSGCVKDEAEGDAGSGGSADTGSADAETEAGTDSGPQPLYAAPLDFGAQPEYAAPFDQGAQPIYAAPVDSGTLVDVGAQPLYAAPIDGGTLVDLGAQPEYAAPFDAGAQPLYAAPAEAGPKDAAPDIDGGPVALYAVIEPVDALRDAGTDATIDQGVVELYGVPPGRGA